MDIYLQLYSIREDEEQDFAHALEMTAAAGYQGVEFAGYFGNSPEQLKALLDKYHLKAVSSHANFGRFDEELVYAKTLGYTSLVCASTGCDSKEEILKNAQFLEACAQKAAKEGIIVGYHNHTHEFKQFDGTYALDMLFEAAPTVQFQADLCWVAGAGLDPATYIKPMAQAGRVCSLHVKEVTRDGNRTAYIGEGILDLKAIAALCPPDQCSFIVEQEEYRGDRLEGITKNYTGLKKVLDSLR
jgi:sugar phosphate isomerase/epimerase